MVQSSHFISALPQPLWKEPGMTQRSSEEWVRELCGDRGQEPQQLAYQELANYLYVVAYNYSAPAPGRLARAGRFRCRTRWPRLPRISCRRRWRSLHATTLLSWQCTAVRANSPPGRPRSSATRRRWNSESRTGPGALLCSRATTPRRRRSSPRWRQDIRRSSAKVDPARHAQQQQVQDVLQRCLARLPERNRLAIVSCIADDVRAELVAQTLNTTANAVYLLIARGKRQLKECLQNAGLSRDVLSLFETA